MSNRCNHLLIKIPDKTNMATPTCILVYYKVTERGSLQTLVQGKLKKPLSYLAWFPAQRGGETFPLLCAC